ncbi:16S rRNA (guanine(966)-N(2))-methyltransferase RsmD [uncultured Desulfuromonas sp.]|uniref:16S rRNA (guanine(966)-N(2))-methyltransferase RsmD n=1 Tax=uncultured Desulfuromonas sp. TaxID=181013 RepID=UPI002AAB86F8|nr:16S rRNA (guanine(966)-N(2))-methyltransferase RsmD [uncultured Desulfuromonas sp.]
MRIISGRARGKQLASVQGMEIRPTSDRVREALFSSLASRFGSFEGLEILDLFAGTGALGLEALSRGATRACFVDSGRQAQKLIQTNSVKCAMAQHCQLIALPVEHALGKIRGRFDLIFLDPPYRKGLIDTTLSLLSQRDLLKPDGLICAEEDKTTEVPQILGRYQRIDLKSYGSTTLHLFAHTPTKETP